ncbi:MAG: hypothetical protein GX075_00890 [Firmicutes bacterium]|nr:hypothetical protein [Bacillota bacterium]
MLEIDDAGGGCFIGPEVLVIHRLETKEAWYLMIPPSVVKRVEYATTLLKKAFRDLGVTKEEPVRLCRGEIFDPFQKYLEERQYQVVREKVSASTDQLAETKFMDILHSYGFPRELALEQRNYHDFYEMVAFWYYSCKQRKKGIRKARLQPPYRARRIAQKYPHLFRLIFAEEAAG